MYLIVHFQRCVSILNLRLHTFDSLELNIDSILLTFGFSDHIFSIILAFMQIFRFASNDAKCLGEASIVNCWVDSNSIRFLNSFLFSR